MKNMVILAVACILGSFSQAYCVHAGGGGDPQTNKAVIYCVQSVLKNKMVEKFNLNPEAAIVVIKDTTLDIKKKFTLVKPKTEYNGRMVRAVPLLVNMESKVQIFKEGTYDIISQNCEIVAKIYLFDDDFGEKRAKMDEGSHIKCY